MTSAVSWSRVSEEAVVVFPLDSEEADCVVFSTLSSLFVLVESLSWSEKARFGELQANGTHATIQSFERKFTSPG